MIHCAPSTALNTMHKRSIASTARVAKALPSLMNSLRASEQTPTDTPVLRMLMFGKPGAGKGTLSSRLVKKYPINFLSTGDLLRQHIADRTEIGRVAEEIVASGGLLPDDVMIRVITSKLDGLRNKAWILDGFPRTLGQGQLLDSHLRNTGMPLSLIINLDVPDDVILSRISGESKCFVWVRLLKVYADRWVHLPSGRVYNLSYNAPKVEGRDDETGEPLTKRPDDNPEIFSRRLKAFYESTSPLLTYYGGTATTTTTKIVTLKGTSSDEIWPQLDDIVSSAFKLKPRPQHTSVHEAVIGRTIAGDRRINTPPPQK